MWIKGILPGYDLTKINETFELRRQDHEHSVVCEWIPVLKHWRLRALRHHSLTNQHRLTQSSQEMLYSTLGAYLSTHMFEKITEAAREAGWTGYEWDRSRGGYHTVANDDDLVPWLNQRMALAIEAATAPVHVLKTWIQYYDRLVDIDPFRKTVEIRPDDRRYAEGDILVLRRYDPDYNIYTGAWIVRQVSHVTRYPWMPERQVALSLYEMPWELDHATPEFTHHETQEGTSRTAAPSR